MTYAYYDWHVNVELSESAKNLPWMTLKELPHGHEIEKQA